MPRRSNTTTTTQPSSIGFNDLPIKPGNNNTITSSSAATSNGTNITIQSTNKQSPVDMEDLIHLPGPLTEDAVMRTLQSRFNDNKYFVSTFV